MMFNCPLQELGKSSSEDFKKDPAAKLEEDTTVHTIFSFYCTAIKYTV